MNKNHLIIIILLLVLAVLLVVVKYHHERKKNRKRREEALYTLIMDNSVLAPIGALIILIILVVSGIHFDQEDIIDIRTIVTIVFTGVLGLIMMVLRQHAINRLEDDIKLSSDYTALIKKYSSEDGWYDYDNSDADWINFNKLTKKERQDLEKDKNIIRFPVIRDTWLIGKRIAIFDSNDMYELPMAINRMEDDLFRAHDTSHLYNQLNIRVSDWKTTEDTFTLYTERTTYFKSMVTNRAMDFRMKNEMTVRDILQYGPFLPTMGESRLSNHLGFNGFIITSDNKLPLVKRKADMSIGKNTYGPSVGASLKTKYCLDENRRFTVDGLIDGIKKEIVDELKIPIEKLRELDTGNIVAAYRDIVEGSKPQLLFCYRVDMTRDEVTDNFIKVIKEKREPRKWYKSIEEQEEEDGSKLLWIDIGDLDKILYTQSDLIVNGVKYSSVPSATVSLLMLKELCEKRQLP